MRSAPQRRAVRPAASLLVLAGLTGAGCSADVTRFAYLDAGGGYASAPAYEARPAQTMQPVRQQVAYAAPPAAYAAPQAGNALPPPADAASAPAAIAPAPMATPASVAAVAPVSTPATPTNGRHTVASGDNLWGLARRYGTTRDAIAAKNGIAPDATLQVGQTIAIPAPGEAPLQVAAVTPPAPDMPVVVETPVVTPVANTPTVQTAAPTVATAPAVEPAAAKSDVATLPNVTASDDNSFKWPVRGRIISEFGKKPDGQKNDGINLVVPEGTPVKASRDGEVIYAGNELEGYGNLVLVRHPGNWVTAYAHNSELLVKRGDQVRRGQPVAKAGRSGNVSFPQVHFEIRKGATPVNPMSHLQG